MHRRTRATGWRCLSTGREVLLVLLHLRTRRTYAQVAAGFDVGGTTVHRYVSEGVVLLGAFVPPHAEVVWAASLMSVENARPTRRGHPYTLQKGAINVTIIGTTVSLTVDDVLASQRFFTAHLGYAEQAASDGFVSLGHDGAAVDIVLLARGTHVLPPEQRDQLARGLILAFITTDIEAEEKRLRAEGVEITLPLREEPWGERLFQITDPSGVIVQFVEWLTPSASENA